VRITDSATTGVDGETSAAAVIELAHNHPNPFNPKTTISYQIAEAGQASLEIYDTMGRRVRSLVDEYVGAGSHAVDWDGRDDQGRSLVSGVYLYRLRVGGHSISRRALLVK
jgi:flagellar hook assembly protein FlgD